MATTLDDAVSLRTLFWVKVPLSKSNSKQVSFPGAFEPIQMNFIQMAKPLSQFIKFAIKVF